MTERTSLGEEDRTLDDKRPTAEPSGAAAKGTTGAQAADTKPDASVLPSKDSRGDDDAAQES